MESEDQWVPDERSVTRLPDAGGRTSLWRVLDTNGQPWLLQVLEAGVDDEGRRRWRNGIELQKRAEGAGVAAVHCQTVWQGRPALVLHDRGGAPLARWLAAGPLGLEHALAMAAGVAGALVRLEALQIRHRDLSPRHILWQPASQQAELAGFEFALGGAERQPPGTASGMQELDLACVAPELTGRTHQAGDSRSDLYSLGICLYWALAGAPPLQAHDALGWIHAHLAQRPRPLHELVGGPPETVSLLVGRLLEKQPDARYQSAWGLLADLQRCLKAVRHGGQVAPFALGSDDHAGQLKSASRLYGREAEMAALQEALERASAHGSTGVCITGAAGIGKSAVVDELRRAQWQKIGRFVSGKIDQFQRGVPYAAVRQVLDALVQDLTDQRHGADAIPAEGCLQALGENFPFLQLVAPSIVQVPGLPRSLVPEGLSPVEVRMRVYHATRAFLQLFGRRGRPLLVFLDDLQWADSATLELLAHLLGDESLRHVLVVFSYRDNEVDSRHPVTAMLNGLAQPPLMLVLQPLAEADVAALLADSLRMPAERIRPLAGLISTKTAGNPFFIQRFLDFAVQRSWLRFDRTGHGWVWDDPALRGSAIMDNVVDLLVSQMQALPTEARALLGAGAVAGSSFDVAEAARPLLLSAQAAGRAVERLVSQGFLREQDAGKHAFSHDRIQETALHLLSDGELRRLHGELAANLLALSSEGERERRLFEIVGHLFHSTRDDSDPRLRLQFAELALPACRRAHVADAKVEALLFAERALQLLGASAWEDHADLCFDLHCEAQAAAFSSGQFDKASGYYRQLQAHARGPHAMAMAHFHMISQLTMTGQYEAAIGVGLQGLAELGLRIGRGDVQEQSLAELDRFIAHFDRAGYDEIAAYSEPPTPGFVATVMLVRALLTSTFLVDPLLTALLGLHTARMCIEHKTTSGTSVMWTTISVTLIALRRDHARATAVARFGLRLAGQQGIALDYAQAQHILALFCVHWTDKLSEAVEGGHRAFRMLDDYGAPQLAGYTFFESIYARLESGEPLPQVDAEISRGLSYARKTGNRHAEVSFLGFARTTAALQGGTARVTSLDGDGFAEARYVDEIAGNKNACALYLVHKLVLANHGNDVAAAMKYTEDARRFLVFHGSGIPIYVYQLHAALARSSACQLGLIDKQEARLRIEAHAARFEQWVATAPQTFSNKLLLVRAELACLAGDDRQAIALYERAIDEARTGGFVHEEALTAARAARWLATREAPILATAMEQVARAAYLRWGASALHPAVASESATATGGESLLDLQSILKSAEAISAEMDYEALLRKLIALATENAGAEQGMLMRVQPDGTLDPQAWVLAGQGGGEAFVVGFSEQDTPPFLPPEHVVRTVLRSQEALVLGDASLEESTRDDAEVRRRGVRSLMCVPLVLNQQLMGALYLENNLAPELFTPQQTRVLGIIAGQAAIALENARLYGEMERRVRERTRELQARNLQLAQEVEERTAAEQKLQRVHRELEDAKVRAEESTRAKSAFLANMSHEIRTPMNAIIGMSGLAMSQPLPPKARHYIESVSRASHNLLGIINDILDFSKIEAGKLTLEKVEFRLDDVLDHVGALIGQKAAEKELEFLFDVAPNLPEVLVGDPLRLGQVLINLAGNAVKFTEAGHVILGCELAYRDADSAVLHLWVSDTGIGMTSQQCERLFESFSQGDSSTTRKYGGTGLGLAISHKLVEQMEGEIWVDSEAGRGTSFHCRARFGVSSLATTVRRMPMADRIRGLHLLIADDNAMAREIMSQLASTLGMSAETACDGLEAIRMVDQRIARGQSYDLMFLDWKMPMLDGLECLIRLTQRHGPACPPAVLVTVHGVDDLEKEAQGRGLDAPRIFYKPYTPSAMLQVVGGLYADQALAAPPDMAATAEDQALRARLAGARLLLVEDNDLNQELVKALLEEVGVELVIATHGQHALDLLERDDRFDLVLMDCQMPVMDGYAAAAAIRRRSQWDRLPIVAMTANAMETERDKVLQAGMNDYVSKPLEVPKMFATIARWLGNGPSAGQAEQAGSVFSATDAAPSRWDSEAGLASCMGNQRLFNRILGLFVDGAPKLAAELRTAARNDDQAKMIRAAHDLQSNAGSIGARALQEAASELERLCRQSVTPPEFERAFDRVDVALSATLEAVGAALARDAGTSAGAGA